MNGMLTDEEIIDIKNCERQGQIFELAAENGHDMFIFSDLYMNSDFCNRCFDAVWSLYHLARPEETFIEMLDPELEDQYIKNKNGKVFNTDAAYWIGYIYRRLCQKTGLHSKEIAEKVQKIVSELE